jgi:Protein of unknown function (DUF1592)/Protein of unknown function (DUF1588)/Protein of unknown function (DUF1587)
MPSSRRPLAGPLAVAALLLQACVGDVGPSKPPQGEGSVSSTTLRRLSVHELGRTFEQVLGFVPQAMERIPPDSHAHSFDRVVNGQTMSPAHLEAFRAIGHEAATSLVGERRLAELVSCPATSIPDLEASAVVTVGGNAFSLDPDWAVTPSGDPLHATMSYAPDPSGSFTQELTAPGSYLATAVVDLEGAADVALLVDDVVVASVAGASGPTTVEGTFEGGGSHVFTVAVSTEPDDNGLIVTFQTLSITGPLASGVAPPDADVRACAIATIDELAPVLQRHALAPEDRARLVALYDGLVPEHGAARALHGVVQAIVNSPRTLYQVEIGTPLPGDDSRRALDAWELAARLSYALCEQPPDAELRAAAQSGLLATPAGLAAEATRLMDAPCGEAGVVRFVEQWLHLNRLPTLNKSPEAFPSFTAEARAGMVEETQRFVREIIWSEQAALSTLFDADHAWPSASTASIWGLPAADGSLVTLGPERAGLLTSPAVLAVTAPFEETSPVERGVFMLEQILCDGTPPPPADLEIVPPLPDPNLTTRDRWAAHSNNPGCVSCHQTIDPIGFAFEDFDGIGQHRTEDNGHPVDASGGVPNIGIADGSLVGGAEAARAMASSDALRACAAKQWLRNTLGRLELDADEATLSSLADGFAASSMREAMLSFVTSEPFRYRVVSEESP